MTREYLQKLGIRVHELPLTPKELYFQHKGKRRISKIKPRKEEGYLYICFVHEGRRYKLKASRVVYALRYGECPDNMNVAYKDGNKLNILPENLELITVSERFNRTWERRKK